MRIYSPQRTPDHTWASVMFLILEEGPWSTQQEIRIFTT